MQRPGVGPVNPDRVILGRFMEVVLGELDCIMEALLESDIKDSKNKRIVALVADMRKARTFGNQFVNDPSFKSWKTGIHL